MITVRNMMRLTALKDYTSKSGNQTKLLSLTDPANNTVTLAPPAGTDVNFVVGNIYDCSFGLREYFDRDARRHRTFWTLDTITQHK